MLHRLRWHLRVQQVMAKLIARVRVPSSSSFRHHKITLHQNPSTVSENERQLYDARIKLTTAE